MFKFCLQSINVIKFIYVPAGEWKQKINLLIDFPQQQLLSKTTLSESIVGMKWISDDDDDDDDDFALELDFFLKKKYGCIQIENVKISQ